MQYELNEERQRQVEVIMTANPNMTEKEAILGLIDIQGDQGGDVSDLEEALGVKPSKRKKKPEPQAETETKPVDAPSADPPSENKEETDDEGDSPESEDENIWDSPSFEEADERVKLQSDEDDDEASRRPPSKGGKGPTGKRPPASRSVRNVFKKVLPPGDVLRVYFTGPTGKKDYIDKYRQRDIQKSGDIESFIREYLAPDYGPGEYFLEQQDAKGDITPRGSITIKGKVKKDDNVMATKDIIELTQKAAESAKKEADAQTTAITSMFNGFMTMMGNQQQKNGGGEGQMMMMVMSLLSTVLPLVMQKREDPMMPIVLNMLMKQSERDNAPAVPFPPVTASAPPNDALDMIRAFSELMRANQTQQPSIVEIMTLLNKKENTMAETMQIIGLLKDFIKPSTEGAKSFGETLENVNAIRNLLEEMNPKGNFSFDSLAEMLNSMAIAYRDTNVAKAMTQQGVVQQGAPQQQAVAQAQAQAGTQQVPAQQPAMSEKERLRRSAPPIPLGFRKYSLAMKKAIRDQDEDELVSQFLEGLGFLHEHGERRWVEFVEKFQTYVKEDEQEKAMVLVKGFLQTFEANDLINTAIAETIYETMNIYWGDVAVALGYREPEEEETSPVEETPDPNAGIEERIANAPSPIASEKSGGKIVTAQGVQYNPKTGQVSDAPEKKKPEPPAPGGRIDPEDPTTGDVLTRYETEDDDNGEDGE